MISFDTILSWLSLVAFVCLWATSLVSRISAWAFFFATTLLAISVALHRLAVVFFTDRQVIGEGIITLTPNATMMTIAHVCSAFGVLAVIVGSAAFLTTKLQKPPEIAK